MIKSSFRQSGTQYIASVNVIITFNFIIFLGYQKILGNKMRKNFKIVQKCGRDRFGVFRAFCQIDRNLQDKYKCETR